VTVILLIDYPYINYTLTHPAQCGRFKKYLEVSIFKMECYPPNLGLKEHTLHSMASIMYAIFGCLKSRESEIGKERTSERERRTGERVREREMRL
jgi:hypothetical protein